MQATIYANRLPRFRSKLAAGKMFSLSGNAIAELGRLLMCEASREWLVDCCFIGDLIDSFIQ
ncbi:unnamed protein product [Brassica oleracea]